MLVFTINKNGEKLMPYKQVSYKHIESICHNNNWQFISHL